ncbi:unnamed protein product, partial [Polarella glacialis]
SSEYRTLWEHLVRTGAAPSRDRFGSGPRSVQKVLELTHVERVLLPDLEGGYRVGRKALLELRGAGCSAIPDCDALQLLCDQQLGLNEVFLYHGCRA